MMKKVSSSLRIVRDYAERKESLIRDGYVLKHETHLDRSVMCRLYHPKRNRSIILFAARGVLQQKTNGKVVHEQHYEEDSALHQP